MPEVWAAIDYRKYELSVWEGEGVLYLLDSGDTHLLTQMGVLVLTLLKDKPLSMLELTERLVQVSSESSFDDSNVSNIVSSILTDLYYLGAVSKSLS